MTLHLAVALDGTGWHPASWREPGARPDEVFTAGYWVDLVREAEARPARPRHHRGLLACSRRTRARRAPTGSAAASTPCSSRPRVGPVTSHIGLVPTVIATHTEPFHVSTAIATLDYVSTGRAGVRVQVSPPAEAAHFGRRAGRRDAGDPEDAATCACSTRPPTTSRCMRRLWDSWEDDAEIRDAATGRFVDRDKLHYIDFAGASSRVRGPSITPRPPQGQPLVTALAHADTRRTDSPPAAPTSCSSPRARPRGRRRRRAILPRSATREAAPVARATRCTCSATCSSFLDDSADAARERLRRLDDAGRRRLRSDARIFTGTAAESPTSLERGRRPASPGRGCARPSPPHDLPAITRELVPELQRRGLFRTAYDGRHPARASSASTTPPTATRRPEGAHA